MPMNCQEARLLIGADPGADDPRVAEHIAQCEECARYRQELRDMDRVVSAALRVDFGAAAPRAARVSPRPLWAVAAGVVVVLVGALAWLLNPRDTFAAQVVDHVNGEAFSLVRTSQPADAVELAGILSHSGIRLKPEAMLVSYAAGCEFRGHVVPHLVVQTEQGPVTVMVLADETTGGKPARFDEGGYRGVVVPAPRGALVVLGQDGDVRSVAATVVNALDYNAW
ncbi:MAG TPA: DUF3379 family protein [Steroidobacteraceae bacterium]|jgi:Protein of unknown function (DUF3379).|nr:DUF3379 family protein [Steroidobacteraceae bacterium]HKR37314.1 DUF3379 family protein [Steroidobacteraceae bacterium]